VLSSKSTDGFGILGCHKIQVDVRAETAGSRLQIILGNFKVLHQIFHGVTFLFCNFDTFGQIEIVSFGFCSIQTEKTEQWRGAAVSS